MFYYKFILNTIRGVPNTAVEEKKNWPPSVIFWGPFSRKGFPQKVFELTGTDCSMKNERLLKLSFTDLQVLNMRLFGL